MSDAILSFPALPRLPFGEFGRGLLDRLRAFRSTDAHVGTLACSPPPEQQGFGDPLCDQKLLTHHIAREYALQLVESLKSAYLQAGTLYLDNAGPDAHQRGLASGVIEGAGTYIDIPLRWHTHFPDLPSIGREEIAAGLLKPSAQALAATIITALEQKRIAGYNLVLASRALLRTAPGTPGTHIVTARYEGFTLQASTQCSPGVSTVEYCIDVLYGVDVLTPDTIVPQGAD